MGNGASGNKGDDKSYNSDWSNDDKSKDEADLEPLTNKETKDFQAKFKEVTYLCDRLDYFDGDYIPSTHLNNRHKYQHIQRSHEDLKSQYDKKWMPRLKTAITLTEKLCVKHQETTGISWPVDRFVPDGEYMEELSIPVLLEHFEVCFDKLKDLNEELSHCHEHYEETYKTCKSATHNTQTPKQHIPSHPIPWFSHIHIYIHMLSLCLSIDFYFILLKYYIYYFFKIIHHISPPKRLHVNRF